MDAFPLHVTEADNEEMLKLEEALAATEADRLRLREQLEQIAKANPREWDELSEPPSQFEWLWN